VSLDITLHCNGRERTARAEPDRLLVDFLREDLGLTGTKYGCGTGDCGACTVLVDGEPVHGCLVYAVECGGAEVTTVEQVSETPEGRLVVDALLRHNGVQCGICTPGFVVTAAGCLDALGPEPGRERVQDALAGNLCRCTGYEPIVAAVQDAAARHHANGDAA
jgi:carbon-monoxide dehydrogenase small subunit